jgi:hypothetical protein
MDPRVLKEVLDLVDGLKINLKEPLREILVREVWSSSSRKKKPGFSGSIFISLELRGRSCHHKPQLQAERRTEPVAAQPTLLLTSEDDCRQQTTSTRTKAKRTTAKKKKRSKKQKEKDRLRLIKFMDKKELVKEKVSYSIEPVNEGKGSKNVEATATGGPVVVTRHRSRRRPLLPTQDDPPPCPYGLPKGWGLRHWGFEIRPETYFENVFVQIKDGQEELFLPAGDVPPGLESFSHLLEDKEVSRALARRDGKEAWLKLRRKRNSDYVPDEMDKKFWKSVIG